MESSFMSPMKRRVATKRNRRRVLLLLPCTNKKPYTDAPTWKFIMRRIEPWMGQVDIAAVDCITNPKTNRPFGIVTRSQQQLTVGRDERPDPAKLPALTQEIQKKLRRLSPKYSHVVSYLNVKTYWKAVEAVSDDFDIEMLPSIYHKNENWNGKIAHSGPIGVFKREVPELQQTLAKYTGIVPNGHPAKT